ncbi:chemotaxis protein CheA [Azospirillum sp. A39]|uniref:chemotaxis protein CheA n=1 Tax=Azospirillum sp. A39 TaxID=3462279 RepID=UPI004046480D
MAGPDFSEIFRQEAQDLLEQLEAALLDLEQSPDDRGLIDGAFRALHTLKGSGAMFGFDRVAAFTHRFETAFDRVRKGLAPPSRDLVAVALSAKDHIRTLVDAPAAAEPAEGEAILETLRGVVEGDAPPSAAAPPDRPVPAGAAEAPGASVTWRVRFRLPRNALVTGANPLLLLDELRALGRCTVTALTDGVPPLDELDPEACHLAWDVTLTTAHPRAAIEDVFIFVLDESDLTIEPHGEPHGEPLGEPPSGRAPPVPAPSAPPAGPAADAEAGEPDRPIPGDAPAGRRDADAAGARDPRPGTSLRVQAERLDELMDRVGELVIAQARLSQLAGASSDANVKSVAEELERLAAGLRDITMGIRMVPIGSLFGRFRRLAHDLSRDLGKDLELVTSGEETELDKTMIERLADPLVHLIRNSIDHGLEDAERRRAAGKPPRGTVRLGARHSGAEVLISVADDGRGLDAARIRAKAEEQGLLAPGAEASDAELFQFLFHAGFSTAREVSAVSGRGVGMDVVKRTIEGLRGTIDVATRPGAGTEVTLRLPLTLAIIDGLLVRVGRGRYAIPLSAVEECVELTVADDLRSRGRSFLNIRGDLVPFLRLRELFATAAPPDPYQKVVIVSAGDLRVGLVVDQIIGSHQTVIKSLSKLHADVETFSGATILGDGTVALILDVVHLVEFGQAREERLKAC